MSRVPAWPIAVAVLVSACAGHDAREAPTAEAGSYADGVERSALQQVRYPPAAVLAGEQGRCRVRISFRRDGEVTGGQLISSTGFADLDQECVEVVKRIGTLPPVPATYAPGSETVTVELPVRFDLGR